MHRWNLNLKFQKAVQNFSPNKSNYYKEMLWTLRNTLGEK